MILAGALIFLALLAYAEPFPFSSFEQFNQQVPPFLLHQAPQAPHLQLATSPSHSYANFQDFPFPLSSENAQHFFQQQRAPDFSSPRYNYGPQHGANQARNFQPFAANKEGQRKQQQVYNQRQMQQPVQQQRFLEPQRQLGQQINYQQQQPAQQHQLQNTPVQQPVSPIQQKPIQYDRQQDVQQVKSGSPVNSDKDFLSSLQIIDTQGRLRDLKDFGLGGNGDQPHEPELERQLRNIFDTINRDLENAAFLPLDVNGANQQLDKIFGNGQQFNQAQGEQQQEQISIDEPTKQIGPLQRPQLTPQPQRLAQPQLHQQQQQQPDYEVSQPKQQQQFQFLKPSRASKVSPLTGDKPIRSPAQTFRNFKQATVQTPETQQSRDQTLSQQREEKVDSTREAGGQSYVAQRELAAPVTQRQQDFGVKGGRAYNEPQAKLSQGSVDRNQQPSPARVEQYSQHTQEPEQLPEQAPEQFPIETPKRPQLDEQKLLPPVQQLQRIEQQQQFQQQSLQPGFDDEPTPLKPVEHEQTLQSKSPTRPPPNQNYGSTLLPIQTQAPQKIQAPATIPARIEQVKQTLQPVEPEQLPVEQQKELEAPQQQQRIQLNENEPIQQQRQQDNFRLEQSRFDLPVQPVKSKKFDQWVPITQNRVQDSQRAFDEQIPSQASEEPSRPSSQKFEEQKKLPVADQEQPEQQEEEAPQIPTKSVGRLNKLRKSISKFAASAKSKFSPSLDSNQYRLSQQQQQSQQQESHSQQPAKQSEIFQGQVKEEFTPQSQQEQFKDESLPVEQEQQKQEELPFRQLEQRHEVSQQREATPARERFPTKQLPQLQPIREELVENPQPLPPLPLPPPPPPPPSQLPEQPKIPAQGFKGRKVRLQVSEKSRPTPVQKAREQNSKSPVKAVPIVPVISTKRSKVPINQFITQAPISAPIVQFKQDEQGIEEPAKSINDQLPVQEPVQIRDPAPVQEPIPVQEQAPIAQQEPDQPRLEQQQQQQQTFDEPIPQQKEDVKQEPQRSEINQDQQNVQQQQQQPEPQQQSFEQQQQQQQQQQQDLPVPPAAPPQPEEPQQKEEFVPQTQLPSLIKDERVKPPQQSNDETAQTPQQGPEDSNQQQQQQQQPQQQSQQENNFNQQQLSLNSQQQEPAPAVGNFEQSQAQTQQASLDSTSQTLEQQQKQIGEILSQPLGGDERNQSDSGFTPFDQRLADTTTQTQQPLNQETNEPQVNDRDQTQEEKKTQEEGLAVTTTLRPPTRITRPNSFRKSDSLSAKKKQNSELNTEVNQEQAPSARPKWRGRQSGVRISNFKQGQSTNAEQQSSGLTSPARSKSNGRARQQQQQYSNVDTTGTSSTQQNAEQPIGNNGYLSAHQLLDTFNPLQFEPERIRATESTPQNVNVNSSPSEANAA